MGTPLRYLLFICGVFLASSLQATAQKIILPLRANKIVYSDTVVVGNNYDPSHLFNNAADWYQHNFETADNTLSVNNSTDHTISGSGIIHRKRGDDKAEQNDIYFTIDITTLPAAYAYSVYDIYSRADTDKIYYSDIYNEERFPTHKPRWTESTRHDKLTYLDARIQEMLSNLNITMKK